MNPACRRRQERAAALVERAYRMALALQSGGGDEPPGCAPGAFERIAMSMELVALLDEARCALLLVACDAVAKCNYKDRP